MTDILVILIGLMVTAAAVGFGGLVLEVVMRLIRKTLPGPAPEPPRVLPVTYRDRDDVMRRAA
ncbi:MAG TPA: hypothetical protein VN345_15900 [Blastocatellia bacterium]|jgi:hypothetical protein|nr:hypothetical protein [Blastocatellia bacterium]